MRILHGANFRGTDWAFMINLQTEIDSQYCADFRPPLRIPIYEWMQEVGVEVDPSSPMQGPYRIENSRWVAEPLNAFQDDDVRMVTVMRCNQGGGTMAQQGGMVWSIVNRPGPIQYNTDHNDKAGDFAEERFWPMMQSCETLRRKLPSGGTGLGKNRHKERKKKIIFLDGTTFTMQGCSETNLQQKSVMTQFNDECFNWPKGRLQDAWIRCNVAYAWNYKVWNGSVAGIDGDDIHETFKTGTQEEWHWHCLKCKKAQIPKWSVERGKGKKRGGIKFNSKFKHPNGDYDFKKIKATVYYECEHCGAKFKDSTASRKALNKGGKYYAMNKTAEGRHRSFRFNILSVDFAGITWGQWVEEFLKANEQYRKYHNFEPLKLFWTRRMAEPWEENKFLNFNRRVVIADYNLGEPNFFIANKWSEPLRKEIKRFMGVDKQESGYYFVVRAVTDKGESRLVDRGTLDSYVEIDAKAKQMGVFPKSVLLDFGYEINECAAAAVKYGWTGMLGVDRNEMFKHAVERIENGMPVKRTIELPYSEEKWKDPHMGESTQVINSRIPAQMRQVRLARYFQWMNLPIKDMLSGFKHGSALYWGVPGDVDNYEGLEGNLKYTSQINSEVRHKIISARGKETFWWSNRNIKGGGIARPNHFFDCELEIFVGMCMSHIINLSDWNPDRPDPLSIIGS